ncbi:MULTISPECIES: hypothetical protein [Delftia]|uniref:Uncharacterized protein n=1 Tax=Delftia lacustris TaxID=558537 RepID=A0A7T3DEU2_9BURK|nr:MULTISPECIES: hypothetical protein [Delftia]EPD34665.1 hypothetical protein HMPREF9702_06207 [Delftia acidovorans CCUG 15835]QPS81679.1 hypothetical protein I6G47_00925 [Delftia lacustris]
MTTILTPRTAKRAPRGAVWMDNGRLVSHSISEPDIWREVSAQRAELRKNPEKLKAEYVKRGILTPGGKLTKRYGGV